MKNSKTKSANKEDLSGKERAIKNVVTSWGSHLVLIVIGFILPRMIHDQLGQIALGIWDLSWSFVNYISLAGYGVGSSVNRYVAKYRSIGDNLSLNRTLSSVVFIQSIICLVVILTTAVLVWFLPDIVGDREGVELWVVCWVVGLLGLSLAAEMAFDTSRGLLTGMHRWDLYNGLTAASRVLSAVFMIISLLMGGGLISLAIVYFVVTLIAEITRSIIATRMCKELHIRREFINWIDIKKMFRFGAKSVIASSPSMLVIQTLNICIASTLGPAALALFARPLALVRHVETFLNKFSFVLTPMVGSISASGKKEELQKFFIETTKYSVAFTLPLLLFLSMLGDIILEIWMGSDYADISIILALSAGYFLRISQSPALRVLMGMNAHGRVAILNFFISAVLLILGLIVFYFFGWQLTNVAILIGVIFSITSGFTTPLFACKAVNLKYLRYVVQAFKMPVISNVTLIPWLLFVRQIDHLSAVSTLVIAMVGSALILCISYWLIIIPDSIKQIAYQKISLSRR